MFGIAIGCMQPMCHMDHSLQRSANLRPQALFAFQTVKKAGSQLVHSLPRSINTLPAIVSTTPPSVKTPGT